MSSPSSRRGIPSVEKVLLALGPLDVPRRTAVAVVRRELAVLRASDTAVPADDEVLGRVRGALDRLRAGRIGPVINATGVLLHTNLGRAPLAGAAVAALTAAGAGYNNLEYDLATGERGGRGSYVEHNLALACGAEAATVVNNCAAALVLMLRHFTRREGRREVIVSRGELIQIGGGFRIPEIMEASGARLREVGTTNHTTVEDYAGAIGPATALLLKVHRSNFYLGGFEGCPHPAELAALARRKRLPFAEDLGSGALAAVEGERTPAEAIRDGVDLVCFSGDKLLGGPQAGLIAGKTRLVRALKADPFFRALRCDKLVLSALQATVDLHLEGRAEETIPALMMRRIPLDDLRARAQAIVAALGGLPVAASFGDATGRIGGGTLPKVMMPSVAVDLRPHPPLALTGLAARLRRGTPPVVGYVSADRYRLDLRTVFPGQDEALVRAVRAALSGILPKNPGLSDI